LLRAGLVVGIEGIQAVAMSMASLAICIDEVPQKVAGQGRDHDSISSGDASTCDPLSLPSSPSTPDEVPSPTGALDSSSRSATRPPFAQVMCAARLGDFVALELEIAAASKSGLQPGFAPQGPCSEPTTRPTLLEKLRSVRLDLASQEPRQVKSRKLCHEPPASRSGAPMARAPFAQKLSAMRGIAASEEPELGMEAARFEQPEVPAASGAISGEGQASRSGIQVKAKVFAEQPISEVPFAQKLCTARFQDMECSTPVEPCSVERNTSEEPSLNLEVVPRAPFAQKLDSAGLLCEPSVSRCSPPAKNLDTRGPGLAASCSTRLGHLAACKGLSDLELSPLFF